MKKYFLFAILIFLFSIGCSQTLDNNIVGMWKITNPPNKFQGTSEYVIRKDEQSEYYLYVNKAIEVKGKYKESENALYFQITGFGPDGPMEKVLVNEGQLISYYLENEKWIKLYQYHKNDENP